NGSGSHHRIRSQTRDSAAIRGGARCREADEGRHQRDHRDWQGIGPNYANAYPDLVTALKGEEFTMESNVFEGDGGGKGAGGENQTDREAAGRANSESVTCPHTTMQHSRRAFLTSTLAASAATAISTAGLRAAVAPAGREYYDLRAYRLKPGAATSVLDGYFEKALLPALDRRGIRSVGVFTELEVN